MPRIAATIGVFALIAFSVGFNISRYPIVWETSDASSHLLPSDESSHAKTVSDSAKPLPTEDLRLQYAAQKPVNERPRYEEPVPYEPAPYEPVPYETVPYETSPYARYTPPEEPSYRSFEPSEAAAEPDDPDTAYDFAVSSPQVAESSGKYGSSSEYGADADSSVTVIAGLPVRPMVPITTAQSDEEPEDSTNTSGQSPSGPSLSLPSLLGSTKSDGAVRRLPSIDQVNAVPEDHQTVQLPMTPIPIYPTTGF